MIDMDNLFKMNKNNNKHEQPLHNDFRLVLSIWVGFRHLDSGLLGKGNNCLVRLAVTYSQLCAFLSYIIKEWFEWVIYKQISSQEYPTT